VGKAETHEDLRRAHLEGVGVELVYPVVDVLDEVRVGARCLADMLGERLEALNLHIQQLTSEIEDASGQSSKLNAERAELEERASGLNSEIQVLAVDVAEQRDVMMKGKGEPGKMKKQVCTPPSVQGRWACCRDCTLFSVWRV